MEFLKLLFPDETEEQIKERALAIVVSSPEYLAELVGPDTEGDEVEVEIDLEDSTEIIAEYVDGIYQSFLVSRDTEEARRKAIEGSREKLKTSKEARKQRKEKRRAESKAKKQEKKQATKTARKTTRKATKKG